MSTLRRPLRAGLGASALALLLATGCSGDTEQAGDTTTTTAAAAATPGSAAPLVGTLTPIEDLSPGQCFDRLPEDSQQAYAVMLIACEDPHTVELYAELEYQGPEPTKAGAPYPGSLVVANTAETQCFAGFTEFMGVLWEESEFDLQAYWPSERSWIEANDRRVLCGVYRVTGEKTKGSAAGSGS